MAEKKPSKYTDRGAIGSAEELDAYGVWVKSEPQDLTASMAETVNFDAEAVPYADFDMEFDDSEESSYDFADLEPEIPEISIENDDDNDSFSEGITASPIGLSMGSSPGTSPERGSEEASTQLLMKIADELSAIRSELSTLKKEFAGVRIESVSGAKAETRHGGFFDGEDGDDEKITLTGDEMENILTSSDFSAAEEDTGYDAQREADEAALKELSAQNESAAETEEEEEIKIDFDNLGINLEEEAAEAQDDFPPLEDSTDDGFEAPPLDTLSLDDMPAPEEIPSEDLPALEEQEDTMAFEEEIEPLEPLEENEELRDLRLEGAIPFTPAPDNTMYLETDPFALDESGLGTSLEEPPAGETSLEELSELSIEDTPVEEVSEVSIEETALEDTSLAESGLDEDAAPEAIPLDTASEITTDLNFDDASFDLNVDAFSTDENLSSSEETVVEEQTLDTGDLPPLEDEINIEEEKKSEDEINVEQSESPAPSEKVITDEQLFEGEALDLSGAVIDEPDLSAGLVEAPLEEPVLGDISFGDDISLDMDDFGAGIDLDIQDSDSVEDSAIDLSDSPVDTLAVDTLAVENIDTSAELGVTEDFNLDSAGGFTDEPVADDVETSVELDMGDSGLAGGLADGLSDEPVTDDVETSVELDMGDSGLADGLSDEPITDDVETSVELDMGDSDLADGLSDEPITDDVETSVELDMGDSGLADGLSDEPITDDVETSVELDMGDSGLAGGLADGLSDEPADEPAGEPVDGLTDDLAVGLAMDDFDTAIDLATLPGALPDIKEEDSGLADSADEPVRDLADDGLTGVIPEGFEENAEEAPISGDDDLEAFADDLSIDGGEASPASADKAAKADAGKDIDISANFKSELKSVLSYMDHLLESLPEDKIEEFAKSEYFDSYKKIFKELGLV
jgi:hypothetical protein